MAFRDVPKSADSGPGSSIGETDDNLQRLPRV